MSHYNLSGTGIQSLTPATAKLYVAIVTPPAVGRTGRANPPNRYDVGLLRLGIGDWYYAAFAVDADQMVADVPGSVTNLGYSLFEGATIGVDEDTAPSGGTTSVSTDLDGTAVSFGDAVTVTFARTDPPDVNDWVSVVDTGWNIGTGRAFGYLNPEHFPYTSSCTDTPGGSAVGSGSCASALSSPFGGSPATLMAVYVDGVTNTVLATGSTFTVS